MKDIVTVGKAKRCSYNDELKIRIGNMINRINGKVYDSAAAWSRMIENKLNEIIDVVNELKEVRDAEKKIENKDW